MPEEINEGTKEILTSTNHYGTVHIETAMECPHIDDMINELVRPLLRGAGFTDSTIASRLGEY